MMLDERLTFHSFVASDSTEAISVRELMADPANFGGASSRQLSEVYRSWRQRSREGGRDPKQSSSSEPHASFHPPNLHGTQQGRGLPLHVGSLRFVAIRRRRRPVRVFQPHGTPQSDIAPRARSYGPPLHPPLPPP